MSAVWSDHLETMERAIASADSARALRAWRKASRAALQQTGWQALLNVARAVQRIGVLAGPDRAAQTRARDLCWAALIRAHLQSSSDGVRATAAAFANLGDRAMADRCLQLVSRPAASVDRLAIE
jgi:hypothetical protein